MVVATAVEAVAAEVSEGEVSQALGARLETLSESLKRLGDRLAESASGMISSGTLPPAGLLDDVASTRKRFDDFREEVRQAGVALSAPDASSRNLGSVDEIHSFLGVIAAAEAEHGKRGQLRKEAKAVLDRVLALTHRGQSEFAPLGEVHAKARALAERISAGSPHQLPEEVDSLLRGDHPLARLLALVDPGQKLNDEEWAQALEVIEKEFGKPLSVAAARERLVIR